MAAPSLCVVYYSWSICRHPTVRNVSQMALCALVGFSLPLNFRTGLSYGINSYHRLETFKADLLAGKPTSKLLAHHASSLCPCPFGEEPTWGIATQRLCGAEVLGDELYLVSWMTRRLFVETESCRQRVFPVLATGELCSS